MHRRMFLPIVSVLGAVTLFAILLMTGPSSGSSDVGNNARQVPVQVPKDFREDMAPCSTPEVCPDCNGSCLSNCDMPMLQQHETRPEPPGTPYYERTDRDGSATLYDITRKNTRLAAYKLGLRGPGCTATRDAILGR